VVGALARGAGTVALPRHPGGFRAGSELISVAQEALEGLPERQRVVVTLRDMLGFDSAEVCELLGVSVANPRVLLHRGRAAVRNQLENYLRDAP
jgi:RNA polymerase sigma-70 factor (ECF subfamily)